MSKISLFMQVQMYDIFLDIDFKNLKFEGRVLIEIESDEDIILNSLGLRILSARVGESRLQFEHKGEDLKIKSGPFKGTLEIEYTGVIPESLVGIYKAPYNCKYVITTHFEAAHARSMFPCIDHPEYKAEFKLTVKVDKGLDAISNMPIETVNVEDEKKVVAFEKTPKMSSYLLYLGVGEFEEYTENLGNIKLIMATSPGKASKGKFALKIAKKSMEFYQSYFGLPYSLPKAHFITVPEFAAGAMENWGAVTFRESMLHIDEESSVNTKKRVTDAVAHELAHMWFGNLVTMKWWNDLWLNESFATFMSFKAIEKIRPEWEPWHDFLLERVSGAYARDSLRNTHPIDAKIKSPSDIDQIFDAISYGKGAGILRMLEAYVGIESFRKGINHYLNQYKYSNATGNDLWNSLEKTSGKQIKLIMKDWIKKSGYPIITVMGSGNKLILKQERFLLSGVSERDIWPIPVNLYLNGEKKKILLDKEETAIDVKNLESLKLNIDQTGFYRVYYKGLYGSVWKSELSTIDRWGIIFDAVALLVAGKMPLKDYFSLVRKYYSEQDYMPAREVSDQLQFLYLLMPSKIGETLKKYHKRQLKLLKDKTDENSSMLRGIMANRLSYIDDVYAKELGSRFQEYEKVEPNMKQAVAVAYARAHGGFEEIIKKYRESDSDEERVRLINSLASFKEPSLVAISLGLALSGEIKRQDVVSMVTSATANPEARDIAWTWFKLNMQRIKKIYQGTGMLSRIILSIIPVLGIGKVEEVKRFFMENPIPEADKGIKAGLEKLKIYDDRARALAT